MRKNIAASAFIAAFVLVSGSLQVCLAKDSTVTVTYLANEGVSIRNNSHHILIDALFREGVSGYQTLPETLRNQLENARPPYDRVNTLLVTHRHADHFDRQAVAAFLQSSPSTSLIAGEEVVQEVGMEIADAENFRLYSSMPHWQESDTIDVDGITIRTLRMRHGSKRNYALHHLGFIIELNNIKILHIGDLEIIPENFAPFRLVEEKIDIALLPYWMLTYDSGEKIVRDLIRPQKIVAIHIWTPELENGRSEILRRFPDAVVFSVSGQQLKSR